MGLYARDNSLHCALLDPSVKQEIRRAVLHIGGDYTRSAKRQRELIALLKSMKLEATHYVGLEMHTLMQLTPKGKRQGER